MARVPIWPSAKSRPTRPTPPDWPRKTWHAPLLKTSFGVLKEYALSLSGWGAMLGEVDLQLVVLDTEDEKGRAGFEAKTLFSLEPLKPGSVRVEESVLRPWRLPLSEELAGVLRKSEAVELVGLIRRLDELKTNEVALRGAGKEADDALSQLKELLTAEILRFCTAHELAHHLYSPGTRRFFLQMWEEVRAALLEAIDFASSEIVGWVLNLISDLQVNHHIQRTLRDPSKTATGWWLHDAFLHRDLALPIALDFQDQGLSLHRWPKRTLSLPRWGPTPWPPRSTKRFSAVFEVFLRAMLDLLDAGENERALIEPFFMRYKPAEVARRVTASHAIAVLVETAADDETKASWPAMAGEAARLLAPFLPTSQDPTSIEWERLRREMGPIHPSLLPGDRAQAIFEDEHFLYFDEELNRPVQEEPLWIGGDGPWNPHAIHRRYQEGSAPVGPPPPPQPLLDDEDPRRQLLSLFDLTEEAKRFSEGGPPAGVLFLIDSSASMSCDVDGLDASPDFVDLPWDSHCRYHLAVLALYHLVRWIKEGRPRWKLAVGTFSETTSISEWVSPEEMWQGEVFRSLAPDWGGGTDVTWHEVDVRLREMEHELEGGLYVVMVTDGGLDDLIVLDDFLEVWGDRARIIEFEVGSSDLTTTGELLRSKGQVAATVPSPAELPQRIVEAFDSPDP